MTLTRTQMYKILVNVYSYISSCVCRSLAEYMREQGKAAFSKQGEFTGNVEQCEKRLVALERLTKGHWSQQYPRSRKSSALGLTSEQCRYALSEEYQKGLQSSRFFLTIEGIKGALFKKSQ